MTPPAKYFDDSSEEYAKSTPFGENSLFHPKQLESTNSKSGQHNNNDISFTINWYSDRERKIKVSNAVLGDTVYYRIKCSGIANNTRLKLKMYDTDQPFGNTNLNKYQYVSVRNGVIESSVYFGVGYYVFIDEDTGDEIEIHWKVDYNGKNYDIFNSILHLQDDEYYRAINAEKYIYTCNCGWVDASHAFERSKRPQHLKVGPDRLWKQLKEENGLKSKWGNGYMVTYTQDIVKLGISIGVTNNYFVKYDLAIADRERIAITIMQDVSMEFEQLQALHPTSGSSFEPADLVSNILGLYNVLRPELTKDIILRNKCKQLTTEQSLKVYKKYPGTFMLSIYKNKKFTPRFFQNDYCKNSIFPNVFQEIIPYPKNDSTFRNWIDLFDIYEGVPPVTSPY